MSKHKKSSKHGISPDKIIKKYENFFPLLSTGDMLFTLSQNSSLLLEQMNAANYITEDDLTDMTSYINIVLRSSGLPKDVYETFDNIFTNLLDIAENIDNNITAQMTYTPYVKITNLLTEFTHKYTFQEYACFARKIIESAHLSLFIMPLIQLIDMYYDKENVYLDCSETKQQIGVAIGHIRLTLPICTVISIDNIASSESMIALSAHLFKYITAKYGQNYISAIEENHQKCVAETKFQKNNSIRNKYIIDASAYSDTYFNLSAYNQVDLKIGNESKNLMLILYNILLQSDRTLLMNRRFIMKNGKLSLKLNLSTLTYDNKPIYVDNISINETTVRFSENEEKRILYIDYTCLGHTQHIPLLVNNIHALLYGCGAIDLYVTICILCLYEVFYLPEDFDDNIIKDICCDILPHFKEYAFGKPDTNINDKQIKRQDNQMIRIIAGENIKINAYVRRLPTGQHASENAKELAHKYYVNLPDNYTIVAEHTRQTRKSLKTDN